MQLSVLLVLAGIILDIQSAVGQFSLFLGFGWLFFGAMKEICYLSLTFQQNNLSLFL